MFEIGKTYKHLFTGELLLVIGIGMPDLTDPAKNKYFGRTGEGEIKKLTGGNYLQWEYFPEIEGVPQHTVDTYGTYGKREGSLLGSDIERICTEVLIIDVSLSVN